jgi:hypothetical protein
MDLLKKIWDIITFKGIEGEWINVADTPFFCPKMDDREELTESKEINNSEK